VILDLFNRGVTAEEFARCYPVLNLAYIYQAETLRQAHTEWSPAGLRDRLLDRRNSR